MTVQSTARVVENLADMASAMRAVIEAGASSARRHWVPATSGNFSARVDANRVAITATGTDKGALCEEDVIVVGLDDAKHPRASAEAPLHYAIYRALPDVGAVLHVHSLNATLASLRLAENGKIVLKSLELLKAFSGIKTHDTSIVVPVFTNTQDIDALADEVVTATLGRPGVYGFLLEGHGIYAWGRTPAEAWRHLEAFDYLFNLQLELRRLS
ncbi:MAG TPA: methylthioribulose 1-phosphate dehydratase [Magnetospirillaceae bacterium]